MLYRGIESRALGYRPGAQHAFHFESKIVVQAARRMFLNYEDAAAGRTACARRGAEWLGRAVCVALAAIFLERHRVALRAEQSICATAPDQRIRLACLAT